MVFLCAQRSLDCLNICCCRVAVLFRAVEKEESRSPGLDVTKICFKTQSSIFGFFFLIHTMKDRQDAGVLSAAQ